MQSMTSVYTHRVATTGELIEEMEYKGMCDIDAIQKFTGCVPHDLYLLSKDPNDVGCIITAPTGNGNLDPLKIVPGDHIVIRKNKTVEIWIRGYPLIKNLELVSKRIIFT